MKTIILTVGLLLTVGCAATTVVDPKSTSSSEFAPINETQRHGVVKYYNEGWDFAKKSNREAAYKQMYKACGGQYRIVNEGSKNEAGYIIPVSDMAMATSDQYVYIEFECVKE